MRRSILLLLTFLSLNGIAQFTSGNLVVYRIGDGVTPIRTDNTGNPVFLDEYTPTGTLVQSIALPTADEGANKSFVARNGLAEGLLNRSADGRYIIFPGYHGLVGSNATERLIGRIDFAENIDLTTTFTSSGGFPSAISDNGTDIWAVSSNTVYYTTLGSNTATAITNSYGTAVRDAKIFNNQLYVSTANSIAAIGSGKPTTGLQSYNNLPGSISGNFYQFVMFDLNPSIDGPDVLYVADQAGTIEKYSLVGGNWAANGTIAAGSYVVGLTGEANGNTVTLYAVTNASFGSSGGASIKTITDASGYNATLTGTLTTLVSAATNTTFRGIAFTPTQFVLPIKFESFSATRMQASVGLTWRTSNSSDVQYKIERSSNGRDFSVIAKLAATGSSHFYKDMSPLEGVSFYRIQAEEPNGHKTYSHVIRIKSSGKLPSISVFPSPVKGRIITMQIDAIPAGQVSLFIINSAGQVMKRIELTHSGYDTSYSVNVEGLVPGVYVLKLHTETAELTDRILLY